jgi:hypothetical protein
MPLDLTEKQTTHNGFNAATTVFFKRQEGTDLQIIYYLHFKILVIIGQFIFKIDGG